LSHKTGVLIRRKNLGYYGQETSSFAWCSTHYTPLSHRWHGGTISKVSAEKFAVLKDPNIGENNIIAKFR
jgi:hypothetical protein